VAEAKYDMTAYPVQVAVRSETDGAKVYGVFLPYCPCADFTNRKGVLVEAPDGAVITVCKHLVQAFALVAGWHRTASKDEVRSGQTKAEVVAFLCGDRVRLTSVQARSVMDKFLRHDAADYSGRPGTGVHGIITRDPRLDRYDVTVITS
jgi:hypothetical protein